MAFSKTRGCHSDIRKGAGAVPEMKKAMPRKPRPPPPQIGISFQGHREPVNRGAVCISSGTPGFLIPALLSSTRHPQRPRTCPTRLPPPPHGFVGCSILSVASLCFLCLDQPDSSPTSWGICQARSGGVGEPPACSSPEFDLNFVMKVSLIRLIKCIHNTFS